jgi:hypothetical protein
MEKLEKEKQRRDLLKNQIVYLRPSLNINYYLFVSNDNTRNYGSDFDVRCHKFDVI